LSCSGSSRLSLSSSEERSIAWFVDADVKLVGVEELALGLIRICEISSDEDWCCLARRSSSDTIISARVVISKRKSSSEPSPLKSPQSIGEIERDREIGVACAERTIAGTRTSTVRIVLGISRSTLSRSGVSDLVTSDQLNMTVECGVIVRLLSWCPCESNESSSVIVSRPVDLE